MEPCLLRGSSCFSPKPLIGMVCFLQDILEHQKKMEEEARVERERLDKERLLALKNKEKREQSAVASSEVKQKLQVCGFGERIPIVSLLMKRNERTTKNMRRFARST